MIALIILVGVFLILIIGLIADKFRQYRLEELRDMINEEHNKALKEAWRK